MTEDKKRKILERTFKIGTAEINYLASTSWHC